MDAPTLAPTDPPRDTDADTGVLPPPTAPPPTPPTAPPFGEGPTPGPARRRSGGHIAALIIGCVLLLPGLGGLAGGTTALTAQAFATDDDGYFTASVDRLSSDGVAIVASDLWLDGDADFDDPWVVEWLDVDVRLRATGAGPTDEVFVGIARTADVERYLAGIGYDELVEVRHGVPLMVEVPGDVSGELGVAAPTDEDFWVASTAGAGEQELEWSVRNGRWTIVAMNADGSPIVEVDVDAGVRSGLITPVGVAMIIGGLLVTAGAVVLIVVGARGRRQPTIGTAS